MTPPGSWLASTRQAPASPPAYERIQPKGATIATVRTRLQERSGFGRVWIWTLGDTLATMGKKGTSRPRAGNCNATRTYGAGAPA